MSGTGNSFNNSYNPIYQGGILPNVNTPSLGGNPWNYESKGGVYRRRYKKNKKTKKCNCNTFFGYKFKGGKKSRRCRQNKVRKTRKSFA